MQQQQKRAQMTPDTSFGLIFVVAVIFFLQHGTCPGPANDWTGPGGPGPGLEKMSQTWPGPDLGQSSGESPVESIWIMGGDSKDLHLSAEFWEQHYCLWRVSHEIPT